jgi:hypothetical protein
MPNIGEWSQVSVADRGQIVQIDERDAAHDHRRWGRYRVLPSDGAYWYARLELGGGGSITHGDTIGPRLSEQSIRAAAQGSVSGWVRP